MIEVKIPLSCFLLIFLLSVWCSGQKSSTGFDETFALAENRSEALKELIPGTRDYYFYHCLERQHAQAWKEVDTLLANWIERYGHSKRVQMIENRQALLRYAEAPEATMKFLQSRLSLHFGHQPERSAKEMKLPSRVDPIEFSREQWVKRAFDSSQQTLRGFTPAGVASLTGASLNDRLLARFLKRVTIPDVPNLTDLVIREMKLKTGHQFGTLSAHKALTLAQLEACSQEYPALLHDKKFVAHYVQLLKPRGDVNVDQDLQARREFLQALRNFSNRLSPSQNSLKAQILFQQLLLDQKQQQFNKDRFLTFIKLPIQDSYVNDDYLRKQGNSACLVDIQAGRFMGIPRITGNKELIRSYLEHFFVNEDSTLPYAPYLDKRFLNRTLAETKILAGIGDMERWYSLLDDPAYYEKLKNRVEVKLAPHNKDHWAPEESVSLDVDIKNVKTLLVKLYEINTANYYAEVGKEVDASITIDGLVATKELSFQYKESPLRRVRRTFDFPSLSEPGVWVIEFIGNGLSSRAIIAKGRLTYRERTSSAGQVFHVIDDKGQWLKEASILFGQKKFKADEDGEILLPFSTRPRMKPFVLLSGNRASLSRFYHQKEQYTLAAPAFLAQESLIGGSHARILIRPNLMINGNRASIDLLEETTLTITSTNHLGVESTLEIRDLALKDNQEYAHTITVPHKLTRLTVQLSGKIQNISQGKKVVVAGNRSEFRANLLDPTTKTASPLLTRTKNGYEIHVLGKNGEAIPDYVMDLQFSHRHFSSPYETRLKTDAHGIVFLGPLKGIYRVKTDAITTAGNTWQLQRHGQELRQRIHGTKNETIRLPYLGHDIEPSRSAFALYRLNDRNHVRDYFSHIALQNGFIELRGLDPGNYRFTFKEEWKSITIAISGGSRRDGWARQKNRELALTPPAPFHVSQAKISGDELMIQCRNAGTKARVHVFATRFLPSNQPFDRLRIPQEKGLKSNMIGGMLSSYSSGITISDEYRYILDRRFATKYPGNMLKRPELLLNPWSIDSANDSIGLGGGSGGQYGGRKPARRGRGRRRPGGIEIYENNPGLFPNYRFMPAPPLITTNLRPDASGKVLVNLEDLGDGHIIHILGTHGSETIYRQVIRETQDQTRLDHRLAKSFEKKRHVALQKSIAVIHKGETVRIRKSSENRVQQFQTIGDIYNSMRSLSGNQELSNFAFLTGWPDLKETEKQKLYSEHACHELNFFLSRKDPKFFQEIVSPYLSNKAVKTFMDDWLLKGDMIPYLSSDKFDRLNFFERILLLQRTQEGSSASSRYARDLLTRNGPNESRFPQFESALLETNSLAKELPKVGFAFEGEAKAPSRKARRRDAKKNKAETLDFSSEVEEPEENDEDVMLDDHKIRDERKQQYRFKKSQKLRHDKAAFYRQVSPTRRYVEHNYWHRTIHNTTANMIGINRFWSDFAAHDPSEPFVSVNFFETTDSVAEMILALSVLDLPFVPSKHKVVQTPAEAQMRAEAPLILVKREIDDLEPSLGHEPILANQSFFKVSDPTMEVDGQTRQKAITGEFLPGEAYGCRLVISNPTQVRQKLSVLVQIPSGSIPLKNTLVTTGEEFFLDGYRTRTFTYYFYFPQVGTFSLYPVQVASGNKLITSESAKTLKVVSTLSVSDKTSWDYVSQNGTTEDVLRFLKEGNVQKTDLLKIAWRLRDRTFWSTLISYLRSRFVFNSTLWSYGILHQDELATREYLSHQESFKSNCGSYLHSPLLSCDPTEMKLYQHLEFAPLVNGRSHRFGKTRRIQNKALANQFASFTKTLAFQPKLTDDNWLEVTYYLLLQDRIEEALQAAAKVDPRNIHAQIQYDYLRAYLDLYTPGTEIAAKIAARHLNHPIPRWRKKFEDLAHQLEEINNPDRALANRNAQSETATPVDQSPTLDLTIEGQNLTIRHTNMAECQISYYEMDIEFLFSVNPFVRNESGSFAFVRPNMKQVIHLEKGVNSTSQPLPKKYHNANLMIEVRGAGLVKRQTCFSNSLAVEMNERWGRLQVRDNKPGRPLSRVYVKVFAKDSSGQVRFHKDGYTDLRGRFDYASLSGPNGHGLKRFSVLILSDNHGAMIREVNAPTQ